MEESTSYYECLCIEGDGEAEVYLHKHFNSCEKNPGHHSFIPVKTFCMEHLPENVRCQDVFDYIKFVADSTVKLTVEYTSEDRPESFPDKFDQCGGVFRSYNKVGKPFPFSNMRGTEKKRVGSGFVYYVIRFSQQNHGNCRCKEECTSTDWGEIYINTANHVVFDDKEASRTDVDFFYDDDKNTFLTLRAHEIDFRKIDCDWSCLRVYTHDTELLDKLESLVIKRRSLSGKLGQPRNTSSGTNVKEKINVICSHPHGYSKMISIGPNVVFLKDGLTDYRLTYKTDTCPGSSGGPVISLCSNAYYRITPHCTASPDGTNNSGVGRHLFWGYDFTCEKKSHFMKFSKFSNEDPKSENFSDQ